MINNQIAWNIVFGVFIALVLGGVIATILYYWIRDIRQDAREDQQLPLETELDYKLRQQSLTQTLATVQEMQKNYNALLQQQKAEGLSPRKRAGQRGKQKQRKGA